MIHVRKDGIAVCGSILGQDSDSLVDAALASDCDDCRTKLGIAGKGEKTWDGRPIGVSAEPKYEPQPMDLEKTRKIGG